MESYSKQTWTNNASIANATTLGNIEAGIYKASMSMAGCVPLDTFAGADDDAKLSAAMTYAGAQTYCPYIALGNRKYTFNTAIGQPYDGFKLLGSGRGWQSSVGNWPTEVELNMAAGTAWITITSAAVYNYHIEGIYFTSGNTVTQFARATTGHALWSSNLRNLSFYGYKGVLGNSSESFGTDLITIDGAWSVLHCYDTPFNIRGGDDTALWTHGMNIGSGDDPSGGGGKYLMMFSSNSKFDCGPVYVTADNGWRGIQHTGSQSSGYAAVYRGLRIEGRNTGSACDGNLFRMTGGAVVLRDCSINCGMDNPLSSEHGLVEALGTATELFVDGCTWAHGNVANTTPCIYAGGSSVVWVGTQLRGDRGGTAWGSARPLARRVATGNMPDGVTNSSATLATGA